VVRQGQSFVKTWRLLNAGTCAWTKDYSLVMAGGDALGAVLKQPLPESVAPGGNTVLSINFTAPSRWGPVESSWELQNPSGRRFGVGMNANFPIWAKVIINGVPPTPTPPGGSGQPTATPLGASAKTGNPGASTPPPTATPFVFPTAGPGSPTSTPASGGGLAGDCGLTARPDYVLRVLDLINNVRLQAGLSTLTPNNSLAAAAQAHTIDMACRMVLSHIGSDGSKWPARISAQGVSYTQSNEIIFDWSPGNDLPEDALRWWLNSPIHRSIILDARYTEFGGDYRLNPKENGYYTVNFILP
jgi:uncharacterized protein YkwD